MMTSNANYENNDLSAVQPWVEWQHIPMGKTHCPTCLQLDKCWFTKADMPDLPQHERCHCRVVPKSVITVREKAKADSALEKFSKYVLDPTNPKNRGKAAMFESWGYKGEDSEWMVREFQRQARQKYLSGEYNLGKLDKHGQRIDIQITIPRKNKKGTVSFVSGWMAEPNGKIRLVTPYGGS